MQLSGRVALVTGAARGIGRGVAGALARAGADVAIADLLSNPEVAKDAELAAQEVSEAGQKVALIDCDISNEASCDAMVAETIERLGDLAVVVPNAGIAGIGTVQETSAEQWQRVLSVNATGTFLTCRAVLPRLVSQGEGSIVNIASTLGLKAVAGRASYVASKFAVVGLTKALAAEVASSGVRVNCVCPSSVRSQMTLDELMDITGIEDVGKADSVWTDAAAKRLPLGRSVEPDDIGRAVVWLCEADMVTGIAIPVTGGEGV
ncbi:MAG: SDR family NAD(P)-dependent oxidoreductase [Myxococcota bacterium]|nr:SDR family NAD(P)-dependent oxidoreductase [Myxococcota bacterium]